MKTKTIILTGLLLLAGLTAQAALPQGTWTVTQVTVERNTDGNIETTVYNSAAEVQSPHSKLQELVVSAQGIVLRHLCGWEETISSYTADGNYLTMASELYNEPIRYELGEGTLTLFTIHSHLYNLPMGQVQQIIENRETTFKK